MQSCGHNSFWNLESHLTDLIYFTRKRNKLQWAYVTIARVALAASSSRNIKCHHYWWADELHWVYAWSHTIYPLYIITYLKVFWRTFLIRRYEEGPVVHPPFLRSVCMSIYIYIYSRVKMIVADYTDMLMTSKPLQVIIKVTLFHPGLMLHWKMMSACLWLLWQIVCRVLFMPSPLPVNRWTKDLAWSATVLQRKVYRPSHCYQHGGHGAPDWSCWPWLWGKSVDRPVWQALKLALVYVRRELLWRGREELQEVVQKWTKCHWKKGAPVCCRQ